MKPENNMLFLASRKGNEMSAQSMFTVLNAFYMVLMGLVSLVGTSALVELVIVLLRDAPRHTIRGTLEPEDA
jgi:hypothetical protein